MCGAALMRACLGLGIPKQVVSGPYPRAETHCFLSTLWAWPGSLQTCFPPVSSFPNTVRVLPRGRVSCWSPAGWPLSCFHTGPQLLGMSTCDLGLAREICHGRAPSSWSCQAGGGPRAAGADLLVFMFYLALTHTQCGGCNSVQGPSREASLCAWRGCSVGDLGPPRRPQGCMAVLSPLPQPHPISSFEVRDSPL